MKRCAKCFNLTDFCTCHKDEESIIEQLLKIGAVDMSTPKLHTGFYL